jgi:hypothetical protein
MGTCLHKRKPVRNQSLLETLNSDVLAASAPPEAQDAMHQILKFTIAVLAFFAVASAAPAGAASTAIRMALVIGNAAYQAGALAVPANDAGPIALTLQAAGADGVGGGGPDESSPPPEKLSPPAAVRPPAPPTAPAVHPGGPAVVHLTPPSAPVVHQPSPPAAVVRHAAPTPPAVHQPAPPVVRQVQTPPAPPPPQAAAPAAAKPAGKCPVVNGKEICQIKE